MMSRTCWRLAAVALSVTALAGCSKSQSDEATVKSVVSGFFSDLGAGRGSDACAALTGPATRLAALGAELSNAPASCPEAVKVVNGQLSSDEKEALKNVKVKHATVNGDQATIAPTDVEFSVNGKSSLLSSVKSGPTHLTKASGSWRIDSLG
ncbi:MAG: hypothetical protein M3256_07310 [Actinomycetota bacterium]|nr:hypothetical protein [Actinomycetota bacterium]